MNLMEKNTTLINIDEISISYKTRYKYSWLWHGVSNKLQNMLFKGSKTMIMAISSTGQWFASPLSSKNNSKTFASFLTKLLLWIKYYLEIKVSNWIIILDNSKKIIKLICIKDFWEIKCNCQLHSSITLTLATIELMFNLLKRWLIKQ